MKTAGMDLVKVKLALMAAGLAVALWGLERMVRGVSTLVEYGRSTTISDVLAVFRMSDHEDRLTIVFAWSSYLLEPLAGMASMVMGWWLIRSRGAMRAVVCVRRAAS